MQQVSKEQLLQTVTGAMQNKAVNGTVQIGYIILSLKLSKYELLSGIDTKKINDYKTKYDLLMRYGYDAKKVHIKDLKELLKIFENQKLSYWEQRDAFMDDLLRLIF